jgi:hypothetical protein
MPIDVVAALQVNLWLLFGSSQLALEIQLLAENSVPPL